MPAKLCENMRKSCMLGRADANRQASVLFDGRLESATIMQGWGAGFAEETNWSWLPGSCAGSESAGDGSKVYPA